MGSASSSMGGEEGEGGLLGELPESCVASVLVYLDPPEICALAKLNRAFRGAASADSVWETKLPRNYGYLLEKAGAYAEDVEEEERRKGRAFCVGSKKEMYARLCRPNPFDEGTKVFWLEKCKGGICMSLSSKSLSITGIDDRRYWNYIPTEESRFSTVAYLQQIWWFEVGGQIEFCFPSGTYNLYFRLHLGRSAKRLGRRVCNMEHVHGWDIKPVRFHLSTSNGHQAVTHCFLDEPGSWIHYHVGDFVVKNSDTLTRVNFSMTQIDCTHTKGGLCVDSVFICPKGYRPVKVFTG